LPVPSKLTIYNHPSLLYGFFLVYLTMLSVTQTAMFAILDKVKPGTESTRGLNLAAVRHTTVQVTGLLL
jgi:hypothetical protein